MSLTRILFQVRCYPISYTSDVEGGCGEQKRPRKEKKEKKKNERGDAWC
jgi:hypothetical protein